MSVATNNNATNGPAMTMVKFGRCPGRDSAISTAVYDSMATSGRGQVDDEMQSPLRRIPAKTGKNGAAIATDIRCSGENGEKALSMAVVPCQNFCRVSARRSENSAVKIIKIQ